ncbi:MAG: hypothetical protein AABX23_04630 [Nanoarchaeota archaeon]
MPNPRFLKLAERLKNDSVPAGKSPPDNGGSDGERGEVGSSVKTIFPDSVASSSILQYDSFGLPLIRKANEYFAGTKAEIPLREGLLGFGKSAGEVQNMYLLKRLAIVTALHKDPSLRNGNMWPITPGQSENLLKESKLPNPSAYWEDLGLILYDTTGATNNKEARALFDSIQRNRVELGLSPSDANSRLVVVNAGLEKNVDMPHGVNPVILPGTTLVYPHDILQRTGENHKFEYGTAKGLPTMSSLGSGNRTIYMPNEKTDIGLRVLIRNGNLNLSARDRNLTGDNADGRVNVAHQGGSPKK